MNMPRSDEQSSCKRAFEVMEAWIDGDLEPAAGDEMSDHVQGCPVCRAELEAAKGMRATLRNLPGFDLPDHVLDAVRSETVDRVGRLPGGMWSAGPAWRPIAFAAAIASALLVAVVIRSGRQAPPPQPAAAEVERVTAETRLALAYLGDAARRAQARVKVRLVDDRAVITTVNGFRSTLSWAREADVKRNPKSGTEGSL
jgi:hypothetical protein